MIRIAKGVCCIILVGFWIGCRQKAESSADDPGGRLADAGGSQARTEDESVPIFVYCAAGVKDPVVEIAKRFEDQMGIRVECTFANSGQLLGQLETTRTGDVYIPGDVGFVGRADQKGLVSGAPRPFCRFIPVILVPKGNPKGIKDLKDLVRSGTRLALADDSAAIGKLQARIFQKNNIDMKRLKANMSVSPATVTDVALAVKMRTVDAGIVWDATGRLFAPDTILVDIPEEKNVIAEVAACVLASTKNAAGANKFLDYLVSEKGKAVLREKGFTVDPAP